MLLKASFCWFQNKEETCPGGIGRMIFIGVLLNRKGKIKWCLARIVVHLYIKFLHNYFLGYYIRWKRNNFF